MKRTCSKKDNNNSRSRYGPPTRTEYRLIVENLSSRVSWQVRTRRVYGFLCTKKTLEAILLRVCLSSLSKNKSVRECSSAAAPKAYLIDIIHGHIQVFIYHHHQVIISSPVEHHHRPVVDDMDACTLARWLVLPHSS
jgi:hypothetical protein